MHRQPYTKGQCPQKNKVLFFSITFITVRLFFPFIFRLKVTCKSVPYSQGVRSFKYITMLSFFIQKNINIRMYQWPHSLYDIYVVHNLTYYETYRVFGDVYNKIDVESDGGCFTGDNTHPHINIFEYMCIHIHICILYNTLLW